jgi:hypothetical protein
VLRGQRSQRGFAQETVRLEALGRVRRARLARLTIAEPAYGRPRFFAAALDRPPQNRPAELGVTVLVTRDRGQRGLGLRIASRGRRPRGVLCGATLGDAAVEPALDRQSHDALFTRDRRALHDPRQRRRRAFLEVALRELQAQLGVPHLVARGAERAVDQSARRVQPRELRGELEERRHGGVLELRVALERAADGFDALARVGVAIARGSRLQREQARIRSQRAPDDGLAVRWQTVRTEHAHAAADPSFVAQPLIAERGVEEHRVGHRTRVDAEAAFAAEAIRKT